VALHKLLRKHKISKEGKKIRWHDGVAALWTLVRYRFAPPLRHAAKKAK